MKVVQKGIDTIKAYANNPRINADAVDRVAMSLREYGFRQPIVVDREGVIIAGHTRWEAAKALGLKKVPVHEADLSEDQARAYRLADNKTHEFATWDDELLALEIGELKAHEFDLDLTAFDSKEVDKILGLEVESGGSGNSAGDLQDEFIVIVSCPNEEEQQKVFEELSERGLLCKLMS